MTRATNLMRARKCQELLPEAKVYKDKFKGRVSAFKIMQLE